MTTSDAADGTPAGLELPSATDIREIFDRKKNEKAAEELKQRQAADEEKKHQKELFLARKLTPDLVRLIMKRVRDVAENGAEEIVLGRFPCAWCTDGGRRINAPEKDWPETLPGIAKEFFDFWERDLKPRGFRFWVEVVSFPNGMPGDIEATLSWGAKAGSEDETV
jgi:hypothetical protein